MSRFSLRVLFVTSAVLFLISPARAQITGATNGTTTPSQGIGHDYIHMLGKTVNSVYGSVGLRLQVPVPPGRRLTLPFSFNYDSNGMYTAQGDGNGNAYMATTSQYLMQAGWSYGLPLASNTQVSKTTFGFPTCYATTGYTFQDSGGTGYSFNKLVGFEHAPARASMTLINRSRWETSMKYRAIWKIGLCLLLLCLGVLLYADALSIHQIYRIPDALINHAPNEQTRQQLLADRDKRNREERVHKGIVEVALAIDTILLLWAASSLLGGRKPRDRNA
jgi:hypothetical protein